MYIGRRYTRKLMLYEVAFELLADVKLCEVCKLYVLVSSSKTNILENILPKPKKDKISRATS